MKQLKQLSDFNTLIQNKSIVMFTASWCPDCTFIAPHLDDIENSFKEYQFISVDRDAFMDLAIEHDVMGIPSFVAFDEGKEIGRFVSKDRKTKEEIIAFIEQL